MLSFALHFDLLPTTLRSSMDSTTFQRITQWEESSKKNRKPVASPQYVPVRAKKDITLQDITPVTTVQKKAYLESKKNDSVKSEENAGLSRPSTTTSTSKKTAVPGSTRNDYYKAWDKFDVDQALEDLDKKEKTTVNTLETAKAPSNVNTNPQKLSKMMYSSSTSSPNPTAANAEKEKGNEFFKKGQFAQAIQHYSASIALDPTNAVLPINRAMALLKLERYSEAERDCTLGLTLDSNNVKALWRRGIARRALGRSEEAKLDYLQALKLEPNNKAVKDELAKLESKKPSGSSTAAPKPVVKVKAPTTATAPQKDNTLQKAQSSKDDLVVVSKSSKLKETEQKAPVFSSKRVPIKVVDGDSNSGLFPRAVDQPTAQKPPEVSVQAPPKPTAVTPKPVEKTATEPPPSAPAHATTAGKTVAMVAPSTTLEFQRDWKSYSKNHALLYQYFKLLTPESLPNLFKSAFESDYLSSMLRVFREHYIPAESPEALYRMLFSLAKVQRFDMTLMFMSGSDKNDLVALFQHLNAHVASQSYYTQQDIAALASKFKTKY
ncbi:RNA polymerase II-associated protein 3 [Podila epigama]|nr:RNA polymerase II-associated protein 3 [Podila epigama]